MFLVEKCKFHDEKHVFQAEKHMFPVRKHKNQRMEKTFVRLIGKKSRAEKKCKMCQST